MFRSSLSRRIIALLTFAAAFAAVYCATVVITNRKQFILIPEYMDVSLGIDAYREILSKAKISPDHKKQEKIRAIGKKIASVSHKPNLLWEFNVLEDDKVVNAFCLPGGKVAFYTGIMNVAVSDDELATIMGHEIAHAIARHGAERMTQFLLVQLGGLAIDEALKKKSKETKHYFSIAYNAVTTVGLLLPYSRTHEEEADEIGLMYMARAGYNPQYAIKFWEKMKAKSGRDNIPQFLSTHPSTDTRIKNLRLLLPKAMAEYNKVVKN